MSNPYSDHTGGYIGANYNRGVDPFSQYGTRRQKFYVIEISNYDIYNEVGWDVEQDATGPVDGYTKTFNDDIQHEYLESPYSILYPILRAAAIKGEVYLNGEPDVEYDGEYPYTYITIAMAQDTIVDSESDWLTDNSWWLEDTIGDAIPSEFNWDNVNVYQASLWGYVLDVDWSSNALSAGKGKKATTIPEARAARLAAGKMGKVSAKKALELAKAAKK